MSNITVESVMDMVIADIERTVTDHEHIMAAIGDLSKLDADTIDEIRNDLLRELEDREPVCAECKSSDLYHNWDGWWWCRECQEDVSVVVL